VELLVVMAIIAILAGLTTAATMAVLLRQKASNTEWILKTAATALNEHWRAVVESAKTEEINVYARLHSGGDERRARAIHIKLRLKEEFPTNFQEALATTYYSSALRELGVTATAGQGHVASQPGDYTEAAVCLLLALQKKRKGVSFDFSSLNTAIADGIYPDAVNGNVTLKQLVDGYGTPLLFYRWPTMNPEVDALNPTPADPRYGTGKFQDSLDTDGTLVNSLWNFTGNPDKDWFEQVCHSVTKSGSPYAYYMIPVIASAGPDHVFQILPPPTLARDPMAIVTPSDDIYSYRLLSFTSRGD
jgi:hypothetical protein